MMKDKKSLWILPAYITWSWLLLIDVARISGNLIVGYSLVLFAYVVLAGLTNIVVGRIWKWLSPSLKKPSWTNVLKIALVWAAIELFIAWAVSVIWMGRNGNWDNVLPFYSLTPLITATPLKFLTRLLGYYGTSAAVGTGIIIIANRKFRRFAPVYWAVLLTMNTGLWLAFRTPNGKAANTVVVSEKLGEPKQIIVADSDFVLLPEYGLDNFTSESVSSRFRSSSRDLYFSGTKQVSSGDGSRNVLVYGSAAKGFVHESAKSRLIVAGEYLPFGLETFMRGIKSPIYDDFQIRRAVVRGQEALKPFSISEDLIGGNGACSSIINSEDYRHLTRDGATLLANSASLEIFRGSRLFGLYHDGLAKFMAVSNARPFLQSSNNWKAFALDHNGNTLASIDPTGTRNVTIYTNSRITPYSYLGEWVAVLGGLYIFKEMTILGMPRLKKVLKLKQNRRYRH